MNRLIILLSLFGLAASFSASAQDIILGQSVPLTGSNAEIGRDMRDGALAVFASVNAKGGISGRKVQLVTLDNVNSRPRALDNTKQLLDSNKVVALFGYNSATTSLDALPLLAANSMAMFAPFTGSPSARDHPNVFTVRASYKDEAEKIVALLKSTGASKSAIIYYDDEAGKSNVAMVSDVFSKETVKPRVLAVKRNAKLDATAFAPLLNEPPQYVIFTTQFTVVGDFMAATQSRNINIPTTAISFVNPDELARTYGTVARNSIVSQVVPTPGGVKLITNGVIKDCASLLADLNGAKINYTSLESCIAAKTLVRVMQKIGGAKITRTSLLRGLENAGRIDLGGFTLDYSSGHHGSSFVDLTFLSRDSQFLSK
jgi:branched-chain amino acid transport system substrate-binding protein